MECGDVVRWEGQVEKAFWSPPAEDIFMIVTKMEILVVRLIARLITSLNMVMAKRALG